MTISPNGESPVSCVTLVIDTVAIAHNAKSVVQLIPQRAARRSLVDETATAPRYPSAS